MAQRIQIPILILTGFLGSGKTSLLSKWLRAPEFEGAMVIVNELGEVGLDDRLIQHSSDVPLLLENGCACCEAAEDLNATLERLFWQRLHRQIPKFNWVLIETTGIADPGALLASLDGHELISERYYVHGVATTFDAKRGPAHVKAHDECQRQIRAADAVILTKTDIASEAECVIAKDAILAERPDSKILESRQSSLPASALLDAMQYPKPRTTHAHSHNHNHANDYSTAFAPLAGPVDWDQLADVLQAVLDDHGPHLLRLKGTACTGLNGAVETVQAVSGETLEHNPLDIADSEKPLQMGLTIIAWQTEARDIANDILTRLGLQANAIAATAETGAPIHA